MLGLDMLDVLIGIVTIYLAFAVTCTAIVEAVSSLFGLRSKNLRVALQGLLQGGLTDQDTAQGTATGSDKDTNQAANSGTDKNQGTDNDKGAGDKQIVDAFYNHPLVKSLRKGDKGLPSYIPPEIAAKVIEAIVITETASETLEQAVKALPEKSNIRNLLQHFIDEAGGEAQKIQQLVASYYDTAMERASGWFKRRTQLITVAVSFVLVFGANVDTIAIVTTLAEDPTARAELVKLSNELLQDGEQAVKSEAPQQEEDAGQQAVADIQAAQEALRPASIALEATGLPLGWHAAPGSLFAWLSKIIGLLVSMFAISLGAPFWFHVLENFQAVRGTGKQPSQQTQSMTAPGSQTSS